MRAFYNDTYVLPWGFIALGFHCPGVFIALRFLITWVFLPWVLPGRPKDRYIHARPVRAFAGLKYDTTFKIVEILNESADFHKVKQYN